MNPRYTDKFRAGAVVMLEAAGYTGDPKTGVMGSVTRVSEHLDVPRGTLRRWFNGRRGPPVEMVEEIKLDLLADIEELLGISLRNAVESAEGANYRDLLIGIGILFDKRQLLQGEPTQILKDATSARETLAGRISGIAERTREKSGPGGANGRGSDGSTV